LAAGDEVLTTNLEYGAMDFLWNHVCAKAGAKYVRQPISLPLTTKQQVVDEFFEGCTPRTKVVFISHITSSTAVILPVQELCAEAKKRGLITIVDGAHVPAHIPLNLGSIQADFYTGACHKWMLTPKGSSFLYVRPEFQQMMDPLVISWGFNPERSSKTVLIDFHELQGTRDTAAFMTVPDALDFRTKYDWENRTSQARETVMANAPLFAEAANGQLLCPPTTEFLGQMCSVKINCTEPLALKQELYSKYRIEIPLIEYDGSVYIRFSFQPYNTQHELNTLFHALKEIRTTTALLK
jgi:isopenicillin-N epimerase